MENTLVIHRFNGMETFQLKECVIALYCNEEFNKINIRFETNETGFTQCADTSSYPTSPNGEFTILTDSQNLNDFLKNKIGSAVEIMDPYFEALGDYLSRFYYYEHEEIEDIKINFLELVNDKVKISVSGFVRDVNFYDGSKPNAKIEFISWFSIYNN